MINDTRRRMQKLISFEDNKRGYAQLAKELGTSWTIVSIAQHDTKKYICVLEKIDNEMRDTKRSMADILKYLVATPLSSKKRRVLGDA